MKTNFSDLNNRLNKLTNFASKEGHFEVIGEYGSLKNLYKIILKVLKESEIPNIDRIVITNNGFYDLEKKGKNGTGCWVGYKHNKSGSTENRMYDSVSRAAELINKVLFNSKGIVEDRWGNTDMFRVYKIEK